MAPPPTLLLRLLLLSSLTAQSAALLTESPTGTRTGTPSPSVTKTPTAALTISRTPSATPTPSLAVGAPPSLTPSPSRLPAAQPQYAMHGGNPQRTGVSAFFGPSTAPALLGVHEAARDSLGAMVVDSDGAAYMTYADGALAAVSFFNATGGSTVRSETVNEQQHRHRAGPVRQRRVYGVRQY